MKSDSITMTLLYDYYGDLLTEKQRTCFDLYHNQDYSLSEIAQDEGISRQGIHDSLLRAETSLMDFERKIGCIARWEHIQIALDQIYHATSQLSQLENPTITGLAQVIASAAASIKE